MTPKAYPCPKCRKMTPWEGNPWRPFCCERCKLLDLGAWATGQYSVPGKPEDDDSATTVSDDEVEKEDD